MCPHLPLGAPLGGSPRSSLKETPTCRCSGAQSQVGGMGSRWRRGGAVSSLQRGWGRGVGVGDRVGGVGGRGGVGVGGAEGRAAQDRLATLPTETPRVTPAPRPPPPHLRAGPACCAPLPLLTTLAFCFAVGLPPILHPVLGASPNPANLPWGAGPPPLGLQRVCHRGGDVGTRCLISVSLFLSRPPPVSPLPPRLDAPPPACLAA